MHVRRDTAWRQHARTARPAAELCCAAPAAPPSGCVAGPATAAPSPLARWLVALDSIVRHGADSHAPSAPPPRAPALAVPAAAPSGWTARSAKPRPSPRAPTPTTSAVGPLGWTVPSTPATSAVGPLGWTVPSAPATSAVGPLGWTVPSATASSRRTTAPQAPAAHCAA
eukprot:286106-Chlamydomonas_euryale.AAC.1